ncbi:hypothetical protein TREAZ_3010 [Leadbettera azotonutricia ZAS-9]|uniref:Uncharacterized protein n=1 Tax=Leadbettera azotonutricia (strain ATCC BAA-888 / DSM 13862 / ZAS-9) TaxID=545695 RepID=F5YB58_LEAAZ|nr:hypothetical protein TREAZ_3010 [Leadbettera azotonutricia ZAS-9]
MSKTPLSTAGTRDLNRLLQNFKRTILELKHIPGRNSTFVYSSLRASPG